MTTRHTKNSSPVTLTFQQIFQDAHRWDKELVELPALPARCIELAGSSLIVDKNSLPICQAARDRLFAKVCAPVSYLSQRSTDLQTIALTEHLQQEAFGKRVKAVIRDGQLFTLLSDELVELNHTEVLQAMTDSLGMAADNLIVSRIGHFDGHFQAEIISESKTLEVRSGDVVKAGFFISHHRYGGEATQIQPFVHRLVCSNGMTRKECLSADGIVRTRRLPISHPRAKELMIEQIRHLTSRTWGMLEQVLTEFRATTERRVDVPKVLTQWLQRARISTRVTGDGHSLQTVMDRLLSAWRAEGAEDTMYGAVNALTRVGTHDQELSVRQLRTLSLLGGLLAYSARHICPRCFTVLSANSHAPEEREVELEIASAKEVVPISRPAFATLEE